MRVKCKEVYHDLREPRKSGVSGGRINVPMKKTGVSLRVKGCIERVFWGAIRSKYFLKGKTNGGTSYNQDGKSGKN